MLDILPSSTKEQCLQSCKDNSKCNWFTYIPNASACELFYNCTSLDTGCLACLSGERTCEEDVEEKGKFYYWQISIELGWYVEFLIKNFNSLQKQDNDHT